MEKSEYIDQIKLQLFGGILESEIDDNTFSKIMDMSLSELNRYYNGTALIEVPASSCIDLASHPEISTVVAIYRPNPSGFSTTSNYSGDPVYMSQLQMYNFGSSYYSNSWIYNYLTYSLNQKIRNTMSTDLDFKEDKKDKKLYISFSNGTPSKIAIEYVPQLRDCSDVFEDYWQDILLRLALAHTKVALGRIRTRFTQSDAVWSGDGATILAEGSTELKELRELLRSHTDLIYPID